MILDTERHVCVLFFWTLAPLIDRIFGLAVIHNLAAIVYVSFDQDQDVLSEFRWQFSVPARKTEDIKPFVDFLNKRHADMSASASVPLPKVDV